MTTRIHLFGPVSLRRPDGGAVSLGGPRQRALLTALSLRPGRPVPVPDLVSAVWGEAPPASVHNALQVHISGLRQALAQVDIPIVRDGATYALGCTISQVDAALFDALVASAQSLLRGGDAAEARRVLERALALAHAPLLAGSDLSPSLEHSRRALEERRLAARRDLVLALSQSGMEHRAVEEAQALVTDDPLDEASWARLMIAQYEAGHPHAALESYRQSRQTLVEELGVEPSPRLADLHHRVLNHQLSRPTASGPAEAATDIEEAVVARLAEGQTPGAIGMATVLLSKLHGSSHSWHHIVTALRCLALGHQQLGNPSSGAEFLGAADALGSRSGQDPDARWAPALQPIRDELRAAPSFAEHHQIGLADPEGVIGRWLAITSTA